MMKKNWFRLRFFGILFLSVFAGVIAYPPLASRVPWLGGVVAHLKVNLGLDLQGGIHLQYRVDTSKISEEKQAEALQATLAVVERRVNAFGVGEPLVQLSRTGNEDRIIVELPGVKDVDQAKAILKETPYLEFHEDNSIEVQKQLDEANAESKKQAEAVLERAKGNEDFSALAKEFSKDGTAEKGGDLDFVKKGAFVPEFEDVLFKSNDEFASGSVWKDLVESSFGWHIIKKTEERGEGDDREIRSSHILFPKETLNSLPQSALFKETDLTGKNLKSAFVEYQGQGLGTPQISLQFDEEGTKLFAELTKKNIGKRIAILIDGEIVTAPTVESEIPNGQAVITGDYTMKTAKALVARLNEGALPAPITLVGQQTMSASLGEQSLQKSLFAGLVGVCAVAIFMIVYYRFLGLVATFSLILYTGLLLSIFKLSSLTPFPITLSLAGIAGFILSIGMAVDANILIFERTWEEIRSGKSLMRAIDEGFRRAWPSIRDGNYSTIITCVILIWLGTGFVKGFALILLIGVLFSMFTAIVITRTALSVVLGSWAERHLSLLVPSRKQPKKEVTLVESHT